MNTQIFILLSMISKVIEGHKRPSVFPGNLRKFFLTHSFIFDNSSVKIYLMAKCTPGYILPLFSSFPPKKKREEEEKIEVAKPVLNHFLKII